MTRRLVDILTALVEAAAYIGACIGIAVLFAGIARAFLGG